MPANTEVLKIGAPPLLKVFEFVNHFQENNPYFEFQWKFPVVRAIFIEVLRFWHDIR